MHHLLPHFERELAFLRTHAGEFARQNPKIAGHLLLGSDAGSDPHVERLIESFALLTSRIHKRLDDDFPLVTESLLQVLYPHYLRPFPSCSVVCFKPAATVAGPPKPERIPRGTLLGARPVRGVICKFLTTQDAMVLPVRVASASFRSHMTLPGHLDIPRAATADLAIEFELGSSLASWASLGVRSLRVYLDGDASQVNALREALGGSVLATLCQASPDGAWAAAPNAAPRQAGFGDDEALIEFDARSHRAYRLLTEYFGFPEKFNFVDLPLPEAVLNSSSGTATLHYLMSGQRSDSGEARLLETIGAENLLLGCTPVINLFPQRADPIRVTHQTASYPVLADGGRSFGYDVYAIDKVFRIQKTPHGETIAEFRPLYSLQHDELLSEGESAGRYWAAHRDDASTEQSPGFETAISIIDVNVDPAAPQSDTLSIEIRATNRDLPNLLSIGNAGGDLTIEGGNVTRDIRLIRKPTASFAFEQGQGALWRLISHLSVNHLSLSRGGIDALREMLRLYDLPRSAVNARQIAGLKSVDYLPVSTCLPGNPFATLVRGIEIRLGVDEHAFSGSGLRLFAQVMDHFFALYVHANSFTHLKLVSAGTREELIACPRRAGDSPLL